MIGPSKELLEKTRRRIDTLILINNIKKKKCRCDLCRFLKKVVKWVEGSRPILFKKTP